MKTKLFFIAAIAASMALQSCENDDDNSGNSASQETFNRMFPNVGQVDWNDEHGYSVANFRENNVDKDAWFDKTGGWNMTETNIVYNSLPQAIKVTFEASQYALWRVDDVDMIERRDMETVYVIEVEQDNQECDLYYSADGTLVKAVIDSDDDSYNYLPQPISSNIEKFIATNYPKARIVETEREQNGTEVDIIDNGTHRELRFNTAGDWVSTKTEVRQADVPTIVINSLKASQYASWRIDDIEHYKIPAGEYYKFELESGNQEVNLSINLDGTIR